MRVWHHHFWRTLRVTALVAAVAIVQKPAISEEKPAISEEVKCAEAAVHLRYPPPNALPKVQLTIADRAPDLSGTDCFAEQQSGSMWITVAAALDTSLDQKTLIERFGAISRLRAALYWSTTDQAWRPMVSGAYAVELANAAKPRPDYSVADLSSGAVLYYRVTDTRSDVPVNYSLQLRSGPSHHILIETANVDPVSKWGITLYGRGDVRTLYFLDEISPGTWSYYSITHAVPATFLAKGHQKSYINRAVALFRYYMALPATSDSPPAR
jgi:hypothetical protein